jgi:PBSX family phage terminase large subunit
MTAPAIEHRYTPYGTQKQAHLCKARELLLSGPAGTGKSRCLIEKMHMLMLRNPGARALMVRKTRDSITSTGLVTYREHVAKEAIEAGDVTYYGGSTAEPAQFRYSNGSKIMIGGMDKPTKVMSSEYDIIYVQEAIELTPTDWENLTTRLRNGKISFQQILADTNPDVPTHWLHERFRGPDTPLDRVMLDTLHEDNPILFDPQTKMVTDRGANYIAALNALTGVRKERLRYGKWMAAEGLVYEDYDPRIHLTTNRPSKRPGQPSAALANPPHDWPRYWVVDFGYTNPFVCQMWAEDGDGRLYLYREVYKSQTIVEDHAKAILKLVTKANGEWKEPKPRVVICDHDAEDRATLERHLNMGTVAAQKTISDGIQAVQARLRKQPDGQPRIYFNPTARVEIDPELTMRALPTSTLEELPGYVWDRAKENSAAAEKAPKELPVKRNDHGCDAMRYMVAYKDLAPQPRIRWLG